VRAAALVITAETERQLETIAQEAGFWTRRARSAEEALPLLGSVDLCILDAQLDGAGSVLSHGAGRQILLLGGDGSHGAEGPDVTHVEADERRLCDALRHLRRVVAAEQRAAALRRALLGPGRFDVLVGRSDETHRLWDRVLACADDARPVLVLGPPGSGKQAIARTLHRVGRRADAPLVRVDCATPGELGSLGAAIDEARGGTLLLAHADGAQGADDALAKVWAPNEDAAPRVIATAERAPETATGSAFWARFDTHRLELSPLAKRPDDVAVLAEHFLDEICRSLGVRKRWSCAALARLEREPWPGNVRELKQFVSRAVLAPAGLAEAGLALPDEGEAAESDSFEVRVGSSIESVERRLILATLAACRGNKPHAARILGISLKTLYNRLSVYRGSPSFDAAPR
jgi:hypothetical protein